MKEFQFVGCLEIKELLGKKAEDVKALLDLIEEAPLDSIYYHTHSYFLRHFYVAGIYPNDFATWAVIQVRDRVLGEKLAEVTPSGDKTLEDIRSELIDIIDNHLSEIAGVPSALSGQAFHFMQSHIIEIPTGVTVATLSEFYEALKTVDASTIYNHVFEARLRNRRGRSDFARWLDEVQGLAGLAQQIEHVDSYLYSLEGLRLVLLRLCEKELAHA